MRIAITLIVLLFVGKGYSQWEPSYRELSTTSGLPTNTVYNLLQGDEGRVYIAHERGLSVYNGLTLRHYSNPLKSTSLSGLMEWEGKIWSRNFYNEVFVTNDQSMEVEKVPELSYKQRGYNTFLSCGSHFYQRKDARIEEILTNGGVRCSTIYTAPDNQQIYDVICDNGTIYGLASKMLVEVHPGHPEKNRERIYNPGPRSFIVCIDGVLHVFQPMMKKLRKDPLSDGASDIPLQGFNELDKANCILQISTGEVLIGTFGGLYLYKSDGTLIRQCFQDIQVSSLLEDKEGNIWVGSLQHGIRILPTLGIKTLSVSETLGSREKISCIHATADSEIYLGTYSGKVFRVGADKRVELMHDFAVNHEIQSLFYDIATGQIWVYCNQLYALDVRTKRLIPQKRCAGPTKSILRKNGVTYAGTSVGLEVIPDTGERVHYHPDWWVKKVMDFGDYMLMETSDGLKRFRYRNHALEVLEAWENGERIPTEHGANLTSYLGRVYFSIGNTVYRWVQGKAVRLFSIEEGNVTGLAVSDQGVYATDGVVIWKKSPLGLSEINATKGLMIPDVRWLQTAHGRLLIAGQDRLQLFENERPVNRVKPTLVRVGGFGTFEMEQEMLVSDFFSNKLSLQFELLPNISANGKGKVHYRIHGVVNDWKEMERSADRYRLIEERLPYGNHTLEIFGVNEDGYATPIQTFNLKILTPYYYSWWFFLLLLAGLGTVTWLLVKRRIRSIQRKNREKLEKERLKARALIFEMRAIRSQMNPHFLFNCLSSIQTKILNDDSMSAYDSLSVFTKLMREALMYTSKEFILLSEEIDFIRKYVQLEQMRRADAFSFELTVDPSIKTSDVLFPSLLSQPFVENAIVHGLMHQKEQKHLVYRVEKNPGENGIVITIEDTGIGRKKSGQLNRVNRKNHESFSTKAIEERVQLLNENEHSRINVRIIDLEVGTRVTIHCNTITHENKHKGNHRR